MLTLNVEELVTGTLHTVHEVVARVADLLLVLKGSLHCAGCHWRYTAREDDALAGLHLNLEETGNIEILVEVVTALKLLHILDSAIPVGLIHELVLLVELHVKAWIIGIHAHADTVLNLLVATVGNVVLVSILTYTAECAEWAQTQSYRRVGLEQGVTDQDSVLVVYKGFLFLEPYTTYIVDCGGNALPGELTDILVAAWSEIVGIVLVQSKVELSTVQNDSLVERRQQHVVFIIKFRNWNNQQTMVLTGITINDCRAVVCTRAVCSQNLLL